MGFSIVGRGKGRLLVALGMGDLTVDLVGQVPQQAHTILHQLGREPERLTETLGAALQVCERGPDSAFSLKLKENSSQDLTQADWEALTQPAPCWGGQHSYPKLQAECQTPPGPRVPGAPHTGSPFPNTSPAVVPCCPSPSGQSRTARCRSGRPPARHIPAASDGPRSAPSSRSWQAGENRHGRDS